MKTADQQRDVKYLNYTEEERRKCALQVQKYSTWKEASAVLGPTTTSLRDWCRRYSYPFPQQTEITKTDLPVKAVKEKRVYKENIKNFVPPKKRDLSDDLKEGIANMLADHVPEKTISRLTKIPKGELREVITRIMGPSRTSMKRR